MAFKRHQFPGKNDDFREKIGRPGVYILMAADDSSSKKRQAYIGESEDLCRRLEQYRRDDEKYGKSFWSDTVVLASKDENLTKSHVRYIESRLIAECRNPRWERKQNQPSFNAGLLPLPDRCDMDRFVGEAKMLVGVLGYDLFLPVLSRDDEHDDANETVAAGMDNQQTFFFRGKGFDAMMRLSREGLFVVQKGSKARIKEVKLQKGYKDCRCRLLEEGILEEKDGFYVFLRDYGFQSPTEAASVVGGGDKNGRTSWKLSDGTEYADWEATDTKSDTVDGNNGNQHR